MNCLVSPSCSSFLVCLVHGHVSLGGKMVRRGSSHQAGGKSVRRARTLLSVYYLNWREKAALLCKVAMKLLCEPCAV